MSPSGPDKLADVKHDTVDPDQPYRILALSGGGYRGLFTIGALAELETAFKADSSQCFDLLAGTSIGGILAAALAVGIPAAKIRSVMQSKGSTIFGAYSGWRVVRIARTLYGLVYRKYGQRALRAVIQETLGGYKDRKLSEIDVPLMMMSVSYTAGAPRILCSRGLVGDRADNMTLEDAALATSAAPTYFPSHAVGSDILVDGGLIANAPDAVALAYAIKFERPDFDKILLLSIGTVAKSLARPNLGSFASGALRWLLGRDLVNLTLTAQEKLSVYVTESLLGDRMSRVDARPSSNEEPYLALDRADTHARKTLDGIADRVVRDELSFRRPQLARFFRGTPIWLKKRAAAAAGQPVSVAPPPVAAQTAANGPVTGIP